MDIQAVVGVNPSVQVAASTLLAYPGQQVTLNGRGASIFVWNSDDGEVSNFTGPQLIVNPLETTTYLTTGSGMELCNDLASTTIYVSDNITEVHEGMGLGDLALYPNPGHKNLNVRFQSNFVGSVEIIVCNAIGAPISMAVMKEKTNPIFDEQIGLDGIVPGTYFVQVRVDGKKIVKKWISLP
jgi:hypothetical protein